MQQEVLFLGQTADMRPEMTLFVGPKLFSMKKAAGALWVGWGPLNQEIRLFGILATFQNGVIYHEAATRS